MPTSNPITPKPVFRPVSPVTTLGTWDKLKLAFALKRIYNTALANNMKINGSWKTSLFGTGGILIIVANVASMLLDGDPNTNPDWSVTFAALMPAIAALFARDNDKSSEDVGVR